MKNITVSVDDEVYHNARVYAAERQTSVSKLVQEHLAKMSAENQRVKDLNDFFREFDKSRANGPYFDASDRLTREELHDRDARRKEHDDALRKEQAG